MATEELGKPADLKRVGECKSCGVVLYLSELRPFSEYSNAGDYNFVCHECEVRMINDDEWPSWYHFVNQNLSPDYTVTPRYNFREE
jgi:hypothetical protein